jgi:ferredoxin
METLSRIDPQICGRCGLCVDVCPAHIPHRLSRPGDGYLIELQADRLFACIKCGHCMAVCPNKAITIDGLSYGEHVFDLPDAGVNAEAFNGFFASRRSVRVFRGEPLPSSILQQIVEMIAMAPMGFPPHKVQVTVVQSRDTIEQALPIMIKMYEDLEHRMGNPLMRFIIRRRVEAEAFNSLRNHLLPTLPYRLSDMKAGKVDTITRGAPCLFLFHARREAEGHRDDALIALTYGLLAAHALGLGATALSLVPPVVDRSADLRDLFQIPQDNKVLASMVLGYPRVRFKRGILRALADVHWI